MKKIIAAALLLIWIACILCACTKKEAYTVPEEGMVFDWYTAPAAVVGEAIYNEITVDIEAGQYYLILFSE